MGRGQPRGHDDWAWKAPSASVRRYTVCQACNAGSWVYNDRIQKGLTRCNCGALWADSVGSRVNRKDGKGAGKPAGDAWQDTFERAAGEVAKLLAEARDAGNVDWVTKLEAGGLGELARRGAAPEADPLYKRNKHAAEKVARISNEQRQTAQALQAATEKAQKLRDQLSQQAQELASAKLEMLDIADEMRKMQLTEKPTFADQDVSDAYDLMEEAQKNYEKLLEEAKQKEAKKNADAAAAEKGEGKGSGGAGAGNQDLEKAIATPVKSELNTTAAESMEVENVDKKRGAEIDRILTQANQAAETAAAAKKARGG